MSKRFFILFPLCIFLHLTSAYSQDSQNAVTLFSHIKLKKIPTTIGMPFMVKQFCTTQVDSTLHAERYFFENATIGKIKSCKLDFAMHHDTVQAITIYLTGHKNYNAAMKQAQKEFGHSVVVMNDNDDLFTWLTKNALVDVQITLQRKSQEWGSEMTITMTKL